MSSCSSQQVATNPENGKLKESFWTVGMSRLTFYCSIVFLYFIILFWCLIFLSLCPSLSVSLPLCLPPNLLNIITCAVGRHLIDCSTPENNNSTHDKTSIESCLSAHQLPPWTCSLLSGHVQTKVLERRMTIVRVSPTLGLKKEHVTMAPFYDVHRMLRQPWSQTAAHRSVVSRCSKK